MLFIVQSLSSLLQVKCKSDKCSQVSVLFIANPVCYFFCSRHVFFAHFFKLDEINLKFGQPTLNLLLNLCQQIDTSGSDSIDEGYALTLQALQHKFGEAVAALRSLPKFHLFKLTPEAGQYFVGFGKAFTINLKEITFSRISR